MMKKLLQTLVAVVCTLFAGSGTAWADTEEINGANMSSNSTFSGTSITIDGTSIAGASTNFKWNSQYALKLRTAPGNKGDNIITISVNSGYKVLSIVGIGASNNESYPITLTGVYVDDSETNLLSESIEFPVKGSTQDFSLLNLNAKSNIKLKTEVSSEYKSSQLNIGATVTYELADREDVTLTNAFNTDGNDQPFTVSPEGNDFYSSSGYSATGLNDSGIKAVSTYTMRAFYNESSDSAITTTSADHQVAFTVIPKKGITFVVTGVSFNVAKINTNSPKIDILVASGESSTTLEKSYAIQRDLTDPFFTNYSKTDLNIKCTKENYFSLIIRPTLPAGIQRGIDLSDIVITGYYTGTAEEEETFEITTSVNNAAYGSVTKNPDGAVTSGIQVTLTAVPNTGYNFVRWEQKNASDAWETLSTANPYTIASLTANIVVQAVFEVAPSLTFSLDESSTAYEGSALPSTIYGTGVNTTTTIPTNPLCYVEGYTFNGWLNGDNLLQSGSTFTFTDLVETPLIAKYEANRLLLSAALSSLTSEQTITWQFAKSVVVMYYEGKMGVYVQNTNLGSTLYDVPMILNAKSGKLDNRSRTDANIQCNSGTILTVPVCNNAVIEVKASNAFKASGKTATTIVGSSDYTLSNSDKTATYTYTGSASMIDITFGDDCGYIQSVSVTYPKSEIPNTITITDAGAATLCLPVAVDIPTGTTAYTGTLSDASLTLRKVTDVIPAEEPVILFGNPGTYNLEVSSLAGTTDEGNSLRGNVTGAEITPPESGVITVLSVVDNVLGFYKWNKSTVEPYKAYLPVVTSEEAPSIRLVFGEAPGNVTGIESITADRSSAAPIFNLAGQKVQGHMAPGIYIQGGKKIIVGSSNDFIR